MAATALAAVAPEKALTPPTRAAVLMALLAFALLGLLLATLVLVAGRWVRRQGDFRRRDAVPPDRSPLKREADADDDL